MIVHARGSPLPPPKPFAQQPHIAPVSASQHIKGVAQPAPRRAAVHGHVASMRKRICPARELVGLVYNEKRQRRSNDVANGRNEPDQRAGDDERAVEEGRKCVDPGNTRELQNRRRARAWQWREGERGVNYSQSCWVLC